ncbi:hypothetical protein AOZ06_51780 [Kibdelosporangium phytohabitans]|uniref:Uncharacterized protein n=1 Tax=Kibdelosporangium phytohabitans TaxID=860235 RepID=A0A0N9IH59_9PSEU|nr:hypothetical protein AOZ06_51780 [Kibdelosporangium phytohabitans]
MRLAVSDEPPMSFDIDELVTTAERAVRRRRALVAVGVSTAAVAVVAVTVPVVLGMGGAPEEIPVAAPPSATASPAPSAPPSSAEKPPLTKQQLTQRGNEMRTYLNTQLPKVAPAAKNVSTQQFGGEAVGDISDGQNYLETFVKFKVNTAQTAAAVQVRNDQEHEKCSAECQELPQQDGSKVLISVESGPGGNNPAMTIASATHLRNDGTITRVTAYNYDPTSGSAPVYQADVTLTVDQMVRLATDPALHL